VDTSGLAKEVDKLGKLGRQIVIAIMLVGLIVGSAIVTTVIALSDVQGDMWLFLFRMAYLGYIIPMLVALIIVFRLVWHWLRGKEATED
jgi:amino acid transporter